MEKRKGKNSSRDIDNLAMDSGSADTAPVSTHVDQILDSEVGMTVRSRTGVGIRIKRYMRCSKNK